MSTSAAATESAIAVSSFPAAALTVSVGASAAAPTVTAMVSTVAAVDPPAPSVAVAVTVRVKSTSLWSGGRIVSVARFQPVIVAVVFPAVAVKVLAPEEIVAPTGIDETVRDRVSDPSVSTSALATDSAIAVSSFPPAGLTVSVGASATAFTVTARFALVVATAPLAPSVAVEATTSVKSTSLCNGGRTVSVARFQPVIVAVVFPAVAVKVFAPEEIVAPTGIDETVRDRVSEPSVSTRPVGDRERDGGVLIPAAALTGERRRVGDRVHRHREVRACRRHRAVRAFRCGCGDHQGEVDVAVERRQDRQRGEVPAGDRGGRVTRSGGEGVRAGGDRGANRDRRDGDRQRLGAVGVDQRRRRPTARSRCPRSRSPRRR